MSKIPSRILIVDDEAPIRLLLGEHLQHCGYEVALAAQGSAALEFLQQRSFDLVLSDVRMPGMNGLELLADIVGWRKIDFSRRQCGNLSGLQARPPSGT